MQPQPEGRMHHSYSEVVKEAWLFTQAVNAAGWPVVEPRQTSGANAGPEHGHPGTDSVAGLLAAVDLHVMLHTLASVLSLFDF